MSHRGDNLQLETQSQESGSPSGPGRTTHHFPKLTKHKYSASDDLGLPSPQESHGLLGSLMSAAHNAANIISPKRDSGFASTESLTKVPHGSPLTTNPNLLLSRISPVHSIDEPGSGRLQASNVHFEPIHDSPVNTLGHGDLSLLHFEEKISFSDLKPRRSHSLKTTSESKPRRLSATGAYESKTGRKRALSYISTAASENTLPTDDNEDNVIEPDNLSSMDTENTADLPGVGEPNSKKRKEFRNSFKNVPASEELLAEFSCALSKDILVHGKLYLTKNLLCFNSNILGFVTNLTIPIQEVIQIEKKSTAVVFPNGMIIKTLYQTYVFASFLSRDSAFSLITKVWNNALRNNRIDNSARLQRKDGMHPTDLHDSRISSLGSSNELEPDLDNESIDDSDSGRALSLIKKIKSKRRSFNKSSEGEKEVDSPSIESKEEDNAKKSDVDDETPAATEEDTNTKTRSGLFKGFQNPGPGTHKPTKPTYPKDHIHIIDQTFKAPVGVVFNLLYGPDNSTFVKILEQLKNFDIKKDGIKELNSENKERNYTYIKPLTSLIGPKQTKCVIKETLLECDFENYCEVEQITQTPDVPLGGSFKVKTKQFFSWGADNTTNFSAYTNIEWSSKSWIKGAIEKGSLEGQKSSMKDMVEVLSDTLNSGTSAGSKKKRKKSKSVSQKVSDETIPSDKPTQPPTFIEHLSNLVESMGSSMPFGLGILGNKGLGSLVLVVLSVLYTYVLLKLIDSRGDRITFGTGMPLTVQINKERYYLTPTVETRLRNEEERMSSSAELWQWILSRTGELGYAEKPSHHSAESWSSEQYKEILRLTKKKIDEAYEEIS